MSINATFADVSNRLLDLMRQHPENQSGDERAFTELALDLFALQFRHMPIYERLCQARDATPGRISHWRAIPAMPTRAFKEFELTSLPQDQRTRVFVSSGTTSQRRSRHFHNEQSLRIYEVSLAPWFGTHLLSCPPQGTRLLILTPSPDAALESSLVHMFDTVRHRFAFASSAYLGRAGEDGAWSLELDETTARLRHDYRIPNLKTGLLLPRPPATRSERKVLGADKIRVLIGDDHVTMTAGLASITGESPGR